MTGVHDLDSLLAAIDDLESDDPFPWTDAMVWTAAPPEPKPKTKPARRGYLHDIDAAALDRITDPDGLTIDAARYAALMAESGNAT